MLDNINEKVINVQKDILRLLDRKQSKYEFPILDKENMDISQVKYPYFL